MIAIIGGSGLTHLTGLQITGSEVIRTPYGDPSAALSLGNCRGRDVLFLARHGVGHIIPPHEINYRANIWALKSRGASRILSIATVGGIAARYIPSVVIGRTAHVLVQRQCALLGLVRQRLSIHAGLEHRFDGSVGHAIDQQRALTGGFQAIVAVRLAKSQHPKA